MNSWRDSRPQGAGGGRWARVWGGDATSSLWARGRSTVVGVNCCVVGGAIGVVVVGGSIGLIVVASFQWGKRVVVACCPLMDKTHATDSCTRRCVERCRGNTGIQHRGGSIVAYGGA